MSIRLFLSILFLLPGLIYAQEVRVVQLNPQPLAYKPGQYCISAVVDDRADKSLIGLVTDNGKKGKVNFQNGAAAALNLFFSKSVVQNKTKQAVTLHISKLNFDIKKVNGMWHVDGVAGFNYYAAGIELMQYTSRGKVEDDKDLATIIDEFMRRVLESDLKKFDGWWQQNSGRVPVSSAVKVVARIGSRVNKPDCIVYAANRPLKITDFLSRPEKDIAELAATLSGTGVETEAKTENGQVVFTVTLTPYFNKNGSWVRPEGKNPRVLAHEQTHFDIAALKTCELVQKLRTAVFSRYNYEALLQEMFAKNQEETNIEEARFDTETDHGTLRDKEAEWERKVQNQVRACGCYR